MQNVVEMLNSLLVQVRFALSDEEGQGLIEYVLIGALISIAVIAGLGAVSGQLGTTFEAIKTAITPKATT